MHGLPVAVAPFVVRELSDLLVDLAALLERADAPHPFHACRRDPWDPARSAGQVAEDRPGVFGRAVDRHLVVDRWHRLSFRCWDED
jgi:hypothetical protein